MRRHILTAALLVLVAGAGVMAQGIVPPIPTDLTAALGPDPVPVVKLGWNVPSGQWGFIVYRSENDSVHFRKLAMINSTVYFDHAVQPGQVYFYYVTTVGMGTANQPIESPPSATVMVRIGGTPDRPIGVLAGTVVDDSTGRPIRGVKMLFTRLRASNTIALPFAITDSLGHYAAKLDTGVYKVKAEPAPWMPPGPPPYQAEWYDDKPDGTSADPVTVLQNASVEANFGLSRIILPHIPKGTIAGKIVDDQSQLPLRGVFVHFFKRGPVLTNWQPVAVTDSLGQYSMDLDTGVYLIRAGWPYASISAAIVSYIPEWFDNVIDPALATPVKVAEGVTFTADFGLSRFPLPLYATIEGIVTDTMGTPLRHATVAILRSLQDMSVSAATMRMMPGTGDESMDVEGVGFCRGVVWKGFTDSLGYYKARVPANRAYIAVAARWGYLPEYYDNKPHPLLADIIKVTSDVTNIDFSLAENPVIQNSISGIVRDSAGNGVPSILVLFPARPYLSPLRVRVGHTDSTGAYTIGNVIRGTYIVLAVPYAGYAPAFYKAGAFGVMQWYRADKVVANGDVSGIDVGVVPIRSAGFARIRGIVRAGGSPLSGVRVFAANAAGDMVGYGLTDGQGGYTIDAVPAGMTILSADLTDYEGTPASVNVSWDTYELSNVDFALQEATATGISNEPSVAVQYALHQNYPNPFNPSTSIAFEVPAAGHATLTVYSLLGQEVATVVNGSVPAGRATVVWNATDTAGRQVASGLYFYRLTITDAGGKAIFGSVKKMMLVR